MTVDTDEITERQAWRMRMRKKQAAQEKEAGDPLIEDGKDTEETQGHQKLLRADYEFPRVKDEPTQEDILAQSNCQTIGNEI